MDAGLRETALRGACQDRHDLNLFQPEVIAIAHLSAHKHSVTVDGMKDQVNKHGS